MRRQIRRLTAHPLVYLFALVSILAAANVLLLKRGITGGRMVNKKPSLQPGDVRLIAPSESAILSRIQFPDREAAILYGASGGNSGHSRNHTQLTLGVASVARVSAPSYVEKTLDQVLAKSSVEERLDVAVVVVCVADADKAVRQIRAKKLYTRYKEHVDNGFIQIISTPDGMYPPMRASHRNPYGDRTHAARWRAKLALDLAFLMAFSQGLSTYFLNLEDDVEPIKENFITQILTAAETDKSSWTSLLFSHHLSIGRLYHDGDLPSLVAFILSSYAAQPVDFLMHYFDSLHNDRQVVTLEPLFRHVGVVSTRDQYVKLDERDSSARFDSEKTANPPAEVTSTISQYKDYSIENAYSPGSTFFWGKLSSNDDCSDDIIELRFKERFVQLQSFVMITGFSVDDQHPTSDRLVEGILEASDDDDDKNKTFVQLTSSLSEDGVLRCKDFGRFPKGLSRLRVKACRNHTGWLVVKMIAVRKKTQIPT